MAEENNQPTMDEIREWLAFHLSKAEDDIKKIARGVRDEFMMANARGSRMLFAIHEKVTPRFESAIDTVLSEVPRIERLAKLERSAIMPTVEEMLQEFALNVREAFPVNSAFGDSDAPLKDIFPKLDEHVRFALRHFKNGLLAPMESAVPLSMTHNEFTVGTMYGGNVQQSGSGSTQTQNVVFNSDRVHELLAKLDELIEAVDEVGEKAVLTALRTAIQDEIDKPEPDASRLRTFVGSIRPIAEGMTGNLAAAAVIQAIVALFGA
ncbi:MAG: hypothetical protein ACR2PA_06485 [Hyphomicrobiaceae bacterium]